MNIRSVGQRFLDWIFPHHTRDISGDIFTDLTSFSDWTASRSNMAFAQCHPILTPALLFVSKLFAQANIYVVRKDGEPMKQRHWVQDLLENPNETQTLSDLLEALMFTQIANGVGVIWSKKRSYLSSRPKELFVLDFSLIEFPDEMKVGKFSKEQHKDKKVVYDPSGENITIPVKDLIFFYDLPNVQKRSPFHANSRLDGLKQTLINTMDSFIAKNIIVKSNGKEMITTEKEGTLLQPDEKEQIESNFANNYGVTFNTRRGIVTNASLKHQSLHIALRDLGLDESVKVDGNVVFTALHIPKDIISLEAKKTTYNNFKESMVSYVQNEMDSSLNSILSKLTKELLKDESVKLDGDYEHLPIMQFILIERYEGVNARMIALQNARKAGLPDEVALKMVGMDTNIKLGEMNMGGVQSDEVKQLKELTEKQVRELIEEISNE